MKDYTKGYKRFQARIVSKHPCYRLRLLQDIVKEQALHGANLQDAAITVES